MKNVAVNFRSLFQNFAQFFELKFTQNDSKCPIYTPDESKSVFKMAQNESKWPRVVLNYSKQPKMFQNDPKMARKAKNDKKWAK